MRRLLISLSPLCSLLWRFFQGNKDARKIEAQSYGWGFPNDFLQLMFEEECASEGEGEGEGARVKL